ncbi:MAG TPA: response regulator [Nitrosopumilaceae archaeon]|nr:response regulator [Nitrosopumilaceae archaeon]
MKIHIIDDNEDITTMFFKYFTIREHSCSVSNDGHNGINMITTNHYDVILLDLAMPEFSGFDIIAELQQSGKIAKLNIVALTASSVSQELEGVMKKMGVKAVLRKPMDPDDLLNFLQKIKDEPVKELFVK